MRKREFKFNIERDKNNSFLTPNNRGHSITRFFRYVTENFAYEVNWQEFESEISYGRPKYLKKAEMKEVEER